MDKNGNGIDFSCPALMAAIDIGEETFSIRQNYSQFAAWLRLKLNPKLVSTTTHHIHLRLGSLSEYPPEIDW